MEAALRTRLSIATALTILTGCGRGEVEDNKNTTSAEQGADPVPAADAERLLEDLAHRHLGLLRGTMGQALLELTETADGPVTRVLFGWPDRLRVQGSADGGLRVRTGEQSALYQGGRAPVPLSPKDHAGLVGLQDGLALALLLPLEGQTRVLAATRDLVRFEAGGVIHEARLDGNRLLALKSPTAEVSFESFLETGLTVLPSRVRLAGIGDRRLRILDSGLRLEDRAFTEPAGAGAVAAIPDVKAGQFEKPAVPMVQQVPERRYLILPDDGDWAGRMQRLHAAGLYLFQAGQQPDGLPTYFELEGQAVCGVPFHPTRKDGEVPQSTASHRIHRIPAHDVMVVVPSFGVWEECVTRGRRLIAQALSREGRAASGSIRVIPFLPPGGPPPSSEQIAALELRLEQPLR